jgi:hypothetical protein
VQQVMYAEKSRNPFVTDVRLTSVALRARWQVMPVQELHLLAMADAYLRGRWLGGGGTERPVTSLPAGKGTVPVTRVSGACRPVRVRSASEFAHALGGFAVERCGGAHEVERAAARAQAEGVPLWIARRTAPSPVGPVSVAVDRRTVRVDVWGEGAPVVRLRAPEGVSLDRRSPSRGLVLIVDDVAAALTVTRSNWSAGSSGVTVELPGRRWELFRRSKRSSQLTCNGHPVALLIVPAPVGAGVPLLPLALAEFSSADPLDAVMTHALAVSFGLGDGSGAVRFGIRGGDGEGAAAWDQPWFTGVGSGSGDSGPGAGGDGWGGDGGGGDSGGGDSGGGGGDSGGGGGDGGGGGGGGG